MVFDEVRITAIALGGYARAIAERASYQAAVLAFWMALTAAGASLVVLVAAGLFLGDNFFGGKRYLDLRTGIVARQVSISMFAYAAFADGTLCKRTVELKGGETATLLGENGLPQGTYKCPADSFRGAHSCQVCAAAEPGSRESVLAPVRRFMVRLGVREILGEGVGGVLALGTVGALSVFIVLMLLVGPMQFVRLVIRAVTRLARTLSKTAIPPRLHTWVSAPCDITGRPVLCQVSDIHMTSGKHVPFELVGIANAPNSEELGRRLSRVMAQVSRSDPLAIALTGDLTDSGHEREWEELRRQLEAHRRESIALIAIPGNHDTQILLKHRADGSREPFFRIDGGSAALAESCLSQLAQLAPGPATGYPQLTTLQDDGALIDVIALDSCRYASNWLLSNAVGEIGQRQLESLRALLAGRVNPTIVLLHHHVGWYGEHRRDARDVMMCAVDGRALLVILAEHAAESSVPVLVLHGHKHMTMSGVFRHNGVDIFVHGCPSSTLGNCAGPKSPVDGRQYWTAVRLSAVGWHVNLHAADT